VLEVGWVELTWRCFILFLSLPCLGTVALISFIYFFLFFGRGGGGGGGARALAPCLSRSI